MLGGCNVPFMKICCFCLFVFFLMLDDMHLPKQSMCSNFPHSRTRYEESFAPSVTRGSVSDLVLAPNLPFPYPPAISTVCPFCPALKKILLMLVQSFCGRIVSKTLPAAPSSQLHAQLTVLISCYS